MVSRAVSIQGQYLFKGGIYSRVVSIQGQYLFKGSIYSRAVFIQGQYLFKGGIYSRVVSIQGWVSLFTGLDCWTDNLLLKIIFMLHLAIELHNTKLHTCRFFE